MKYAVMRTHAPGLLPSLPVLMYVDASDKKQAMHKAWHKLPKHITSFVVHEVA